MQEGKELTECREMIEAVRVRRNDTDSLSGWRQTGWREVTESVRLKIK